METKSDLPETLMAAMQFFNEGDNAFDLLVARRWPNGVRCPQCDSSEVRFIAPRKLWECKHCEVKKQFSVRVGTIFEDSAVSLGKWMCAFWLISNCKNGVSSYEIGRAIGVTQKTGWFMLQRIRLAMESGSIIKGKMSGTVEADETWVGGKAIFMHKHVKARRGITKGNGLASKPAVIGLLQRPSKEQPVSKVLAEVLPKVPAKHAAMKLINENVEKGAEINTDLSLIYQDVQREYIHGVVDHAERYVEGNVHTNGLENFWSLLKRTIKGTYVSVEPCHLFRYVVEQVFRFNERKDENGDQGRFITALGGSIGKRLTYKALIGCDAAELQTSEAW